MLGNAGGDCYTRWVHMLGNAGGDCYTRWVTQEVIATHAG